MSPSAVDTFRRRARTLAANLEPVIGQVFFSPECHAAYEKLGFAPSPGSFGNGVAAPDGPAYFTSRGSLLGQVQPEVVASAFGVFKPGVVVPSVRFGWTITDAPTIFAARRTGAVAQLERVCGPAGAEVARAAALFERAVEPLAEPGRPLFAGLRAQWDDPDGWTRLFHLGDMLREYRGDAHVCAWSTSGVDAIEIGLLTEAYMGLPLRTYIRTRGWDDAELDGAVARLQARGWFDGAETLTEAGRSGREAMEDATDRAMTPALDALGDDLDEVAELLRPWGEAMRAAGGYVGGPVDLWPNRN